EKFLAKDADWWELGTVRPAHYASFSAIINYISWIGTHYTDSEERREQLEYGMNAIKEHERALLYRLAEGTSAVPGLRHIPKAHIHFDCDDLRGKDLIVGVSFDNINCTDAV